MTSAPGGLRHGTNWIGQATSFGISRSINRKNRVLRAEDLNLARGSNKWRLPAGHKDASLRARLPAAEMPSSETGILQPERLPRGLPGALQDFGLRFLDFFVRRLLDAGYVVSRIFGRQNQFVELQL
jgi:hypothetical protein